MKLIAVDKYATEMHNPELTEPQGSGNVPRTNYRTIVASRSCARRSRRRNWNVLLRSMGCRFLPHPGAYCLGSPVLGHSLKKIREGKATNTLFLAKGSLSSAG